MEALTYLRPALSRIEVYTIFRHSFCSSARVRLYPLTSRCQTLSAISGGIKEGQGHLFPRKRLYQLRSLSTTSRGLSDIGEENIMAKLLDDTRVGQLVAEKSMIVSVSDTASIAEALQTMVTHNVACLPVLAPADEWMSQGVSAPVLGKWLPRPRGYDLAEDEGHHYIGCVTTLDFLMYLGEHASRSAQADAQGEGGQEEDEEAEEDALQLPVTALLGKRSEGVSLHVFAPDCRLRDVMEPFSEGMHRVFVQSAPRHHHPPPPHPHPNPHSPAPPPTPPPLPTSPASASTSSQSAGARDDEAPTPSPSPSPTHTPASTPAAAPTSVSAPAAAPAPAHARPESHPDEQTQPEAGSRPRQELRPEEQPQPEMSSPANGSPRSQRPQYCFLTQTDVVRFLVEHADDLGPQMRRPVLHLGLVEPHHPPFAVCGDTEVLETVRLMRMTGKLRTVAVVAPPTEGAVDVVEGGGWGVDCAPGTGPGSAGSSEGRWGRRRGRGSRGKSLKKNCMGWTMGGKLLGSFAADDLRGLDADTLRKLPKMRVWDFLNHPSIGKEAKHPTSCQPSATIMDIATTALEAGVHGVWITDEDGYLVGRGGSDVPDAPVAGTIQSHAADLSHFIRHAVGSPPILIGHSFGGLIVQAYLAELALVWGGPPAAASDGWAAPFSSLTAAALVCSVPPTGNSPMVMRFLRTRPIASFKITMSLAAKKFETNLGLCRESFFSPAMPDDQVARFQALLKGSSRVPLFDLRKLNTELPAGKPPAGGVPPVLVLGAANDFIVDKEGVKETAAYYSTTAVIVPDIAHDVMLDVGWERAAWTLHNWIDGIHI
eukprot:jgi/Mesen1/7227/ME000372S06470